MNNCLTPQLEAKIREKVESGLYSDSSEVVREALRMMERRDNEQALRAALAAGIAAADRGDVVEWTPQLMDELWREGKEQPPPARHRTPMSAPERRQVPAMPRRVRR